MKNRVFLAVAIASTVGLVSANALADNIQTIEGYASGTVVTLDSSPVVTAILSQPGTFGGRAFYSWSFLAQDSTGSIDIYGLTNSYLPYVPTVGDAITASGKYSPFHQIPEIGTLTAVSASSSGNSVPSPGIFTIPQLNVGTLPSNVAGYLVEVKNVTISGAPATFPNANGTWTITDSGNNSMTLYYWYTSYSVDAAMYGNTVPTGPVDILGFMSVYPSPVTPEFTPIRITPVPEPAALSLFGAGALLALAWRRRR